MLKLIVLTSVLVAWLVPVAYAGVPTGDARNQTPPTNVKGTSSQPVHHYGGPPRCHTITNAQGQAVEVCAAQ